MKKITAIICLSIILSGCSLPWNRKVGVTAAQPPVEEISSSTPFYYDISPAEAKEMVEAHNNLSVINATGESLENMILADLNNAETVASGLDKENFILVYSHDGSLGEAIASRLSKKGFLHVYRLQQGGISWNASSSAWVISL